MEISKRRPRWLDCLAQSFGYVPQHRIPTPGLTMHATSADPSGGQYPAVEIIDVDNVCVRYRMPDGRCYTRSRRGFMKNYSSIANAEVSHGDLSASPITDKPSPDPEI